MPLEEVARRVDHRLALLTTGDRSAPERQQTLRATLDWSYDLLGDDERALWHRLSVFAGSFDAAAVTAVAADGILPGPRVADALARLVECSIVQLDDPIVGRYRLLETVREYAAEQAAASGELASLELRHRHHYLNLARQATRTWGTGEQLEWFRRLAADYDNLREALDQCRGTPEGVAVGLEVSARLGIAWQAIGRVGEGQRWIATFLPGVSDSSPVRPLGLWASGYMALARRDLDAAERDLTEARAGAGAIGDEETESWAICHLGLARLFRGEHEEARQLLLDLVERHRSGGRPGVAAFMLADAALSATLLGRTDTAVPEFEEAIAVSREVGDKWTESHALWGLGWTRLRRDELTAAEGVLLQGLRLIRDVGDATGTALAVEALALAAAQLRQPSRAASLTGVADAVWTSIPARPPGPAVDLRREVIAIAEATLGQHEVARLAERSRTEDSATGVARALGEIDELVREAEPATARPLLSRREEQVAALVATGLTNRQIAERLVLSPRTVESHVERIMNRLGIGSRAEIAAWATRHLAATGSRDIP